MKKKEVAVGVEVVYGVNATSKWWREPIRGKIADGRIGWAQDLKGKPIFTGKGRGVLFVGEDGTQHVQIYPQLRHLSKWLEIRERKRQKHLQKQQSPDPNQELVDLATKLLGMKLRHNKFLCTIDPDGGVTLHFQKIDDFAKIVMALK